VSAVSKRITKPPKINFLERLANATVWIAMFTAVAVVIGFLQFRILDQTDQTLKAAQRPWVKVDPQIAGPLTYTSDEARVNIAFVLKNTGNSPAINVQIDPEIALHIQPKKNYIQQMLEICNRVKATPDDNALLGHAIFPGDIFTYKISLAKRRAEIENALSEFQNGGKEEFFSPVIVGCVSYRFAYQRGRHVTQFIVELSKKDPANPNVVVSFKMSDGDVPMSDLVLTRSFVGGNAD
jgi:hypothetical protein